MKTKLFILFAFVILFCAAEAEAQNQKIGYFESEVILAQIPEYQGIEQRLQLLSEQK